MLIDEVTITDPKKGSRKVASIAIAIGIHVVLLVVALLVGIGMQEFAKPDIVAQVIAPPKEVAPQMEKKTVMKQVEQATSAAAASPIARMLRANTTAKIAAPEVTEVSEGIVGLGEGDFGSGFGRGTGGGMGSGATFFGMRSSQDLVIVIDISGSMIMNGNTRESYDLLEQEAIKAISALNSDARFNIITFAAESNAFRSSLTMAGNGVKADAIKWIKSYSPCLVLPRGENVANNNLWQTKEGERHRGTSSGKALEDAFALGPRTIIFVSDGQPTDATETAILKKVTELQDKRPGKVTINAIAYRAGGGLNFMEKLATNNGGKFKSIK
ncbi:MAG: VWA domain-containing protein [Verrucomicrobiae bacterium]|nr:VWA domain-containing protein [Verrucomicrobiae bacterium]